MKTQGRRKPKKDALARLSLALNQSWKTRLGTIASKTKISMHSLAQSAVEAAVEAVEKSHYRIVMPIQFAVTYIPQKVGSLVLREPPVQPESAPEGEHSRKSK